MKGKEDLIYAKRYPRMSSYDIVLRDLPPLTALEEAEIEESVKRIKERLDRGRFEQRPEEERMVRFIQWVKEFPNFATVDVEIYRREYYIEAVLMIELGDYHVMFARHLAAVLKLCDQVEVSVVKDKPEMLKLTLEYFTHDFCVK